MTTKIKALVALAVTLSLFAISAAPASATPEFTSTNPETKKAEHATSEGHSEKTEYVLMTCTNHYASTSSTGRDGFWTSSSESYEKCTLAGQTMKYRSNKCHKTFRPTKRTGIATYEGNYEVSCPEGGKQEFENETGTCLITVAPQKGIGPVTYENNSLLSPQTVTTKVNAKNLTYTTSGLLGCGVANGVHTNGVDVETFTIKSFNTLGKALNFSLIGE